MIRATGRLFQLSATIIVQDEWVAVMVVATIDAKVEVEVETAGMKVGGRGGYDAGSVDL